MANPSFPLPNYLQAQEELFRAATRQLQSKSTPQSLSEAAEWLPDNFYLVQQTCRQIREDMPASFYRQLPKRDAGPLQGYPRVYAVAQKLIVMRKAARSGSSRALCISIRPRAAAGGVGLPVMLRLGLVEFLAQSVSRITDLPRENSLPTLTLPQAITGDETVANCITSLRLLATQDWDDFFESVSRVEHILRDDPTHVYAKMDQETRDRYRKVIEKLALATGQDEQAVAYQAIDLARTPSPPATPRTAHVGYYLLDAGRAQLDARVGYRVPVISRVRRGALDHPTPVYLGSIGLITFSVVLGGGLYAREAGANLWQELVAGLLLLIPALTVSVSLINWIITLVIPPRVLPKMDFEYNIPAEYKTLVVIPSLLSSAAEVKSLLKQVELHFLRSQDARLYFALLTDLPDTLHPPSSDIDPLVAQAIAGINALNDKYHRETLGPFYLFHRDPKWNPHEERWMGWERKRGKLHELNLLLRGGAQAAFSVQTGDLDVLREIKYVITLDADTLMPREAAHRLVATLAHPLNRAEFDPRSGAVIAGYTLLQPGIEITSTSVNRSRFTRIFAGDAGLDLYSRAVSNAYQDLFGEGSYVGKGIYEIDAFERSLAGRMPENALLSHDLIEGIHGRVGLVTDVVLYEDYPPHYFVYLRRARRWIRGDWQLLPWLLPRVPAVNKGTIPNDLSIIGRWKILDNLRRSLLAPALLVLFVAGWLWLSGSPLVWTLAGALTLAVPVLTGLVLGVVQAVSGNPWRQVFRAFETGFVRWVLALAFILYETLLTLGGIATTLVRLFVTRKHLLQWTSYAETVRVFAGGVTFNHILAAILSTGALAGLISLIDPTALFVALPLLIVWLLSPPDRVVDQPPDRPRPRSAVRRRDRAAARAGAAYVVFFRTVRRA
jgi:cyclic beta-1,2-glucan synthetase